ncbi:Histone methylation protein DOT1 [Seminavis robusta]|uniref:Histone-lysine N-methyltransferase, H3 lysine-79 specific n=1 Tax=Seminavis robusta TaxID=568900 RepID=A0A9N8EPG9_9STRA|nr:Histone methylation protein DOT1 [Seminavis robusta]|eukprot:Sro1600_g285050.1 Histone methylation protein DOT1 (329) ;mRNA; r:14480-15466
MGRLQLLFALLLLSKGDSFSVLSMRRNKKPSCIHHPAVSFDQVMEGLDLLYPPQDLEQRNAASRADGYWAYIKEGKDVPLETTYGEFDIEFFRRILERMMELYDNTDSTDDKLVFCDIGSGAGRLVMAAAALFPDRFQVCRGIELLESIHKVAEETLEKVKVSRDENNDVLPSQTPPASSNNNNVQTQSAHQQQEDSWVSKYEAQYRQLAVASATPITTTTTTATTTATTTNNYRLPPHSIPMADMELLCGSFEHVHFGDSNLIFVFSSCMSGTILEQLGQAVAQQCASGTLIVTTEYAIPSLPVLETMDGTCQVVGGTSTAFFHRVQ